MRASTSVVGGLAASARLHVEGTLGTVVAAAGGPARVDDGAVAATAGFTGLAASARLPLGSDVPVRAMVAACYSDVCPDAPVYAMAAMLVFDPLGILSFGSAQDSVAPPNPFRRGHRAEPCRLRGVFA